MSPTGGHDRGDSMTTFAYAARPARLRLRRRAVRPILTNYIPVSTADLWKSAKQRLPR
jgi:hypothetical protein